MKYLYVDETESDEFFIVAGVLFDSKEHSMNTYKAFRKRARKRCSNTKNSIKDILFHEFKSSYMDKNFPLLKKELLYMLNDKAECFLYATYKKKEIRLSQSEKETQYINLLEAIVNKLDCSSFIAFDSFGIKLFESEIKERIKKTVNCADIECYDSQQEKGIQFADNICSTIRRHLSGDDSNVFFEIIRNKTIETY